MSCQTIRVFIGNLPTGVTEDQIHRKVHKYAIVKSLELKHRDDGAFAFVDIEDTPRKVEYCFNKLTSKHWKGHQLRVQQAKESFLQKLAKEREQDGSSFCAKTESVHSVNNSCSIKCSNIAYFSIVEIDDLKKRLKHEKTSDSFSESDKSNAPRKCSLEIASEMKAASKKLMKGTEQNKSFKGSMKTVPNESDLTSSKRKKFDKTSESNDGDTPRLLKMFCGTKGFFKTENEKTEKRGNDFEDCNSQLTNKLDEEKEILKKFESFNNVWKDSSSDGKECSFSSVRLKRVSKQNSELNGRRGRDSVHGESLVDIRNSHKTNKAIQRVDISADKKQESERRRLKAIEDRHKELVKRKQAVKLALASVDKGSSKKIVFDDYDSQKDSQKDIHSVENHGKLALFNDDDRLGNNEYRDDFRIRSQFEGQKGHSLLKLQATYGSDKRFILDERFIESDDEEKEKGYKTHEEILDAKGEKEKVLEILGDVLGRDITGNEKAKYLAKPMLRYDPTKPSHVKFEVKSNTEDQIKNKKAVKKDQSDIPCAGDVGSLDKSLHDKIKATEETLPEVSKEQFYHVSDTLQECLDKKEHKFSLLEMFGDDEEAKEEEKSDNQFSNEKPISQKVEWLLGNFKGDSSEEEENNATTDKRSSQLYESDHGVWQESLFFEKNDDRLIEGLKYVELKNEEFLERFCENRRELKDIIKRKVMTNMNKSEPRNRKLGGKKRNPTQSRKSRYGVQRR